jgi:hypothetical protein
MADIYYRNNEGKEIHFDSHPYYLNRETDLFSHRWDYINSEYVDKIEAFNMRFVEKGFDIGVIGKTAREYDNALKTVNNVFDYDIRNMVPGRLYCGKDYLNCYIIACEQSSYDTRVNKVVKPYKLVAEKGEWIRETYFSTIKRLSGSDIGLDFEYDFSYDFAYSDDVDTVINESVAEADFVMTIYGDALQPEVTIGGNVYAINGAISGQERIVINSTDKTISRISSTGGTYNYFDHRNPEHDIFAKIPSGKHKINTNDDFPVTITLFNYRSEPEWWKE